MKYTYKCIKERRITEADNLKYSGSIIIHAVDGKNEVYIMFHFKDMSKLRRMPELCKKVVTYLNLGLAKSKEIYKLDDFYDEETLIYQIEVKYFNN